jgi:ferredoxin/menaquinone-dependent protoporphyrinogen IX oxidase
MKIDSVQLVYYSPTGNSKMISEEISKGINIQPIKTTDLTSRSFSTARTQDYHKELVIIGAPVYIGRLPNEAVKRIEKIEGNETLAVIVVTYGNRAYDDALLELKNLVTKQGFLPIAGAAFIGEHSFSSEEKPIAEGRPDIRDLRKARKFGENIKGKLERIDDKGTISTIDVPGNLPYKEISERASDVFPSTEDEECTRCGRCADVCPTNAITIDTKVITELSLCTLCSACVKVCPASARTWKDPTIMKVINWLNSNCQARKEPETYL